MSLPERAPDFIVILKQQPLPPVMPIGSRGASEFRIGDTNFRLKEVRKWLEENGVLDQVRFGQGNEFGLVPTHCSKEIAEVLKDAPGIAVVVPLDPPLR